MSVSSWDSWLLLTIQIGAKLLQNAALDQSSIADCA